MRSLEVNPIQIESVSAKKWKVWLTKAYIEIGLDKMSSNSDFFCNFVLTCNVVLIGMRRRKTKFRVNML